MPYTSPGPPLTRPALPYVTPLSLFQTKAFGSAETDQLYAEETAAKIAEAQARLQNIPGMVPPSQVNDDMGDS